MRVLISKAITRIIMNHINVVTTNLLEKSLQSPKITPPSPPPPPPPQKKKKWVLKINFSVIIYYLYYIILSHTLM